MSFPKERTWDSDLEPREKDGLIFSQTEHHNVCHDQAQNPQWHSTLFNKMPNMHVGRRGIRSLWFGLLTISLAIFGLATRHRSSARSLDGAGYQDNSPFTGAFARFPRISALTEKQRRLSAIAIWDDEDFTEYMRHFIYSAQMNSDSLDLLFINRKTRPESKCIDFAEHNVDISRAGNVKVVCMSNEEYQRRHVDLLCGEEYGWGCNATEYDEVASSFKSRPNGRNLNFRPLQGWVFRDLMRNPKAPNWAWLDVDDIIGNLAKFPFNILSETTLVWGHGVEFECYYMAGQLTAFNFEDNGLVGSWKMIPQLQSPQHFTNKLAGEFAQDENEERLWSTMYLQSFPGYPGNNISYVQYPALHGDDFGAFKDTVYVVSGREVLSVSNKWTREDVERLIKLERKTPVDDLGGIGWTGGEDGSSYLVEDPEMSAGQAKIRAISDAQKGFGQKHTPVHQGIVEDVKIKPGEDGTCLDTRNELALGDPPIMRTSYVRFKGQQQNHVLRRYERDDRWRGWERKLIRHHLWTKTKVDFPPFEIKNDMVMRYDDHRLVEVWKMGAAHRKKTLFYRGPDGDNIG